MNYVGFRLLRIVQLPETWHFKINANGMTFGQDIFHSHGFPSQLELKILKLERFLIKIKFFENSSFIYFFIRLIH